MAVLGASILVWCCKMQWDQAALNKIVKKFVDKMEDMSSKTATLETQIKVMEGKYDFMCELVMDDVKQRRRDLWEHHSPLKPTPAAKALVPADVMEALRDYNGNGEQCMIKALYIQQKLSPGRIEAAAREIGLSRLEFMALIVDIEVRDG